MQEFLTCLAPDIETNINSRKLFALAFIIVIVGAIYVLRLTGKSGFESTFEMSPPSSLPSVQSSSKALPTASSPSGDASARAPEDFSSKTATELAPDQHVLREEAQRDPERVPRATLFFAARLGRKMEVALKSEKGAVSLFQELKDCVTSEKLEGSVTSQTLCLQDAQELAQAYPERLKDPYSALFERAEPRVQSLLVPTRK